MTALSIRARTCLPKILSSYWTRTSRLDRFKIDYANSSRQHGIFILACASFKSLPSQTLARYRRNQSSPQQKNKEVSKTLWAEEEKGFDKIKAKTVEPEDGQYGQLGEEIAGKGIDKQAMVIKLNHFFQTPSIRELAKSHSINDKLFTKVFISFRRYCYKSIGLPPELHIVLCDIIGGHGNVADLFPFFLTHAREMFPHIECQEELRKISYLGLPHGWYPEARAKFRKIIFHAGPTNSGKTYHAIKRFMEAKSGIYCGPLKLLAVEIFDKAKKNDVPCDLLTGEERKFANPDGRTRSSHISCTVEMTPTTEPVEVAVIDEIQMLRDSTRGWAWTRALLGLPADEIHLCGEDSAVEIVRKILMSTADEFDITYHDRLTSLEIEDKALGSLSNVRNGDCIVCFNKDQLYQTSLELERIGRSVAVVYGSLPPETKLDQCKKFNEGERQVLVATDAVGMGLNLTIGRVIFYSLMKKTNEGLSEFLTTSSCLQIAGRAGRFRTAYQVGYVTTLRHEDLVQLKNIMSKPVPQITSVGLHPTAEQIELFAFHLPHLSLTNLIDLFIDLCEYDSSLYFICNMESFKVLAKSIEHISLPLRSRYSFCCAPVNLKSTFVLSVFTRFVRQFSVGEPITTAWIVNNLDWPAKRAKNIADLQRCEELFETLELYLWLSHRFPDMFPDQETAANLKRELDQLVSAGVSDIVRLLKPTNPRGGHRKW